VAEKKKYNLFIIIFSCVIASYYILPMVRYSVQPKLIVALGIIFLFVYYFFEKAILKTILSFAFCFFMLFLIYYFFTYPDDMNKSVGIITQSFLSTLPLFLFMFLQKYGRKNNKPIIVIVSLMIAYVLINTYIALLFNPNITRILAYGASNEYNLNIYRMHNIGGFGFSYAVGFLSVYLFWQVINKKRNRIFFLLCFAFSLMYLISTQYFIDILVVFTGMSIILFQSIKNSFWRMFSITFMIILIFALPYIFYWIADIVNSLSLREKFYEIAEIMQSGTILGSSTLARKAVYMQSFNAFLSSPIIGITIGVDTGIYDIVGNHSTVFDFLATTGIIGTSIYGVLIFVVNKNIVRILMNVSVKVKTLFSVCIFLYLVISFLNPIFSTFEISGMLFFYIPMILCTIEQKV